MTLPDVVPAAIPYTPDNSHPVTIPSDTHLLHWGIVWPTGSVRDSESPEHETDLQQYRHYNSLVEDVDAMLAVDGTRVGAVADVVRSDEDSGMGYWNITDPLSPGDHTTTLTLIFEPESPTDTPPQCITESGRTPIRWGENQTVSLQTRISVVEEDREAFDIGNDPLWGRQDVYYPRVDADESTKGD
jgi:hypothetical protein